ncbi:glutathione S-transferase family protein [Piscinibacter sakaiensis]|uniref:glutathione S-transferase family protein n=1 Tax=Piscinibacter sakaiensis TaxID=1547922 RepID=UPI003AAD78BA
MPQRDQPIVHHIPVCPFSQRLEILLELKGRRDAVEFRVVDITKPRSEDLLKKTRGTTALPVMELGDERILKESLVILQYLEDVLPDRPVAQRDPYRRAVENMLVAMEGAFATQGYVWVMNQDPQRRDELRSGMLKLYGRIDDFLQQHAPSGPFLFEQFGWAETVFTPFFLRFWFLDYYEDFSWPDDGSCQRVRQWVEACLAHPAAQQVTKEQIVKLYYDYAMGSGNGALPADRRVSSFSFEPDWRERPWPPRNKYEHHATDAELGLLPA